MRPRPPFLAALLLSAVAVLPAAHAQDQSTAWPVRPIKIVIGFAPGGSTDTPMRVLAESASKLLKQPVIIENKPGAGGTLPAVAMQSATWCDSFMDWQLLMHRSQAVAQPVSA